jgi:serine/threonine protein kinase
MGAVYRATDTSLGRHVAIKVLPDALASDPDRLARFEREAKTLASLNHPNISAIYAVEKSAGWLALVMELVEGEDLSQRIARGAIPLDDALPISKQIAEALEACRVHKVVQAATLYSCSNPPRRSRRWIHTPCKSVAREGRAHAGLGGVRSSARWGL